MALDTHMLSVGWSTTYCGQPLRRVARMTTTPAMTTCAPCQENMALVEAFLEATPEQFVGE